MKLKHYLLASTICVLPFAASAADLPVKAPMRVVQPVPFTWTGFYVGGSAGLISQDTVHTDLDGDFNLSGSNPGGGTYGVPGHGGLFGINAGYNYQTGNWVLGIEADIAASTLDNTMNLTGHFTDCRFGFQSKLSSLGTVRGRIGYAFDRALIYATGGFAYGKVDNNITNTTASGASETGQLINSSGWKTGWTAGGGLEYAVTNNWTVRVEGLYVDLGSTTAANNSGCSFGFKNRYSLARLGMNYKF
jgi:outer membrane immunogenic protein